MTITTIQKWGNSHGVRLTKDVLSVLGVSAGAKVKIKKNKNSIIIESDTNDIQNMTLSDMVKTVPKDMQKEQKEYSWGKVKGNEVW